MTAVFDVIIWKLKEHSALSPEDVAAIRSLPVKIRALAANEDIVRQGDHPDISVVVADGMLARYHTLGSGKRQYLSFHIAGDWPDVQSLFIEKMDHAVCAMCDATIGTIPHRSLLALFEHTPSIGFALWRETLIDAAIFREAITSNSKREVTRRLAHFLCEQYYRAKDAAVLEDGTCRLPLSQDQMGDALGASLTTINRAMQLLRKKNWFQLRAGRLDIRNWDRLAEYGQFNPTYLHLRRPLR